MTKSNAYIPPVDAVMDIFRQLNNIPRPSHHEEKVADFLCDFARKLGLEYRRDENNCVVIRKPASPGHEQAEPVVDSATRVDTEAPKSPASRRHWSHTFMGQFQCSVLQSLAALALSRPESGPKFSRQNKTILFSRKMGGLGWRTQPLAWRLPQLATPAAKSHPLSREQEPNNTASFLLASGSAS